MGLDLVFYAALLIFVDEATEDGSALDPPVGESGIRVVRPGRVQPPAAMGPSSVVMAGVLGEDRPEVSFTEDQHSVGDHGPGGEDEPFGVGVSREDFGAGSSRLRCRRWPGPRRRIW
jgi:hypothetical protein